MSTQPISNPYVIPGIARPEAILSLTATEFGLRKADLLSRNRTVHYFAARQVAYALLHDAGHTFVRIGELLQRHHSSVMSGLLQFHDFYELGFYPALEYDIVKAALEGHRHPASELSETAISFAARQAGISLMRFQQSSVRDPQVRRARRIAAAVLTTRCDQAPERAARLLRMSTRQVNDIPSGLDSSEARIVERFPPS
jgi:hypothetical protein